MQGKPTLWQVMKSVLAAMFGVQNSQNRERDFTQGNPWVFIVVGIVMVILFVLAICGVVHWVIASTEK